jgi:hypothetical protein
MVRFYDVSESDCCPFFIQFESSWETAPAFGRFGTGTIRNWRR